MEFTIEAVSGGMPNGGFAIMFLKDNGMFSRPGNKITPMIKTID